MDNVRALGVHYTEENTHKESLNISKHITYAPSCFMFIKKEVFDSIGYMDEKYFAYYDDTDFVFRACKKGFKLYYESSLTVLHKVSSSSGGDTSRTFFYLKFDKVRKARLVKAIQDGFRMPVNR